MTFMIFIYELLIAGLVFVFFNAISDTEIAIVIAVIVLLYMLNRSLKNPYE